MDGKIKKCCDYCSYPPTTWLLKRSHPKWDLSTEVG